MFPRCRNDGKARRCWIEGECDRGGREMEAGGCRGRAGRSRTASP